MGAARKGTEIGELEPINHRTYRSAAAPRFLVAICSSVPTAERPQACDETWLRRVPANVACFFFLGREAAPPTRPHELILDAPDEYDELPSKVQELFRFCVANLEFDWLFKCDDDTYVVLDRLTALIGPTRSDMVGFVWPNENESVSGGAGYFVSRRLAVSLAQATDIPETGFEDVEFTHAARRAGFTVEHEYRLQPEHGTPPSPDNDLVTSHWCTPDDLREFERAWVG